ncbi:MAG TPA: hypothetical protein DEB40_11045 [Elusimicrobia bacterium]|nr:hypothetical protein [Elusimicrobiota bacterium]HBT62267.1 hypothetical protein [Elusimicrobiota bacterium]
MASVESYDFEKLAREITLARISEVAASADVAAEIADKVIASGVLSTRQRQEPRVTIAAVCRGVAGGLLLSERELVIPSIGLLKSMAQLAQEINLDPADVMTWAMEGIASVAVMGPPNLEFAVREAIDENFMGAGAIFGDLCRKAREKGAS